MFRRPSEPPFVALTPAEVGAAVILIAVVGLVVGFIVLATGGTNQGLVYLAFVVYLVALALPFVWPGFRPGIFHPLVFYVIWLGFKGLLEGEAALAASGLPFHRALTGLSGAELNSLLAKSFLLETLALVSLYVGYALTPRCHMPTWRVPKGHGIGWKSVLWVGVSAIALLVLVRYAGGIDGLLMQRGIPSTERIAAQVGAQWNWLAGIGVVVPLIWLAFDARAVRRPLFWLVLIAALMIKFAATGSRSGVVLPLIMIGVIWMLHYRTVPYRAIVVGIVLALVMIGALGEFRAATQKVQSFEEVGVQSSFGQWLRAAVDELGRRSGENSGQIAVLGKVPSEEGYLFGESYLSIPFVFVPSAVWGDKPDAAGKLVAKRIYERPLTAIPPGPVGEAYWNFSYLGVVSVFLLYGVFLRFVGSVYTANREHSLVMVVFVYVLFNLQPHSPSLYDFFQLLVPAVVIWLSMIVGVPGVMRRRAPPEYNRADLT